MRERSPTIDIWLYTRRAVYISQDRQIRRRHLCRRYARMIATRSRRSRHVGSVTSSADAERASVARSDDMSQIILSWGDTGPSQIATRQVRKSVVLELAICSDAGCGASVEVLSRTYGSDMLRWQHHCHRVGHSSQGLSDGFSPNLEKRNVASTEANCTCIISIHG